MRPTKLLKSLPFCVLLGLPGCAVFSATPHYRGVAVTPDELSQLTPGVSQAADVQDLLGPPTFVEPYDQTNWVYVSQVTKTRIGRTEGIVRQHVVVVSFNTDGSFKSYEQENLKNALRVPMDSKATPSPGGSTPLLEKLIGGVGSYNPLGAVGGNSASPGTGTSALGASSTSNDSGF